MSFSSTASLTLTTLQHTWTRTKSICDLQKGLWTVLRWDHNADPNSSKDKNCTPLLAYLCKKWMHDYLLKIQLSIYSDYIFLMIYFTSIIQACSTKCSFFNTTHISPHPAVPRCNTTTLVLFICISGVGEACILFCSSLCFSHAHVFNFYHGVELELDACHRCLTAIWG